MLRRIGIASFAALISVSYGQTFEVASVKPADPAARGLRGFQGGPGTADPGRITASVTLQALIREAYGVNFDQIQAPAWIAESRYDIRATVPSGATKDDLKLMYQHLLEERFKLAVHHITKDFPIYEVTIGKGGSKLKENTETLEPSRPGDPRPTPDRNGFPQIPAGKSGMASLPVNGLSHLTAKGVPLSSLLFQLGAQLGTMTGPNTYAPGRIVDKTGLTGKYDFNLEFAGGPGIGTAFSLPAAADASAPLGPTLIEAMEKQLGLKLIKTTASLDVLVIDQAEKIPTEN